MRIKHILSYYSNLIIFKWITSGAKPFITPLYIQSLCNILFFVLLFLFFFVVSQALSATTGNEAASKSRTISRKPLLLLIQQVPSTWIKWVHEGLAMQMPPHCSPRLGCLPMTSQRNDNCCPSEPKRRHPPSTPERKRLSSKRPQSARKLTKQTNNDDVERFCTYLCDSVKTMQNLPLVAYF